MRAVAGPKLPLMVGQKSWTHENFCGIHVVIHTGADGFREDNDWSKGKILNGAFIA
jgi:hypothetical protein